MYITTNSSWLEHVWISCRPDDDPNEGVETRCQTNKSIKNVDQFGYNTAVFCDCPTLSIYEKKQLNVYDWEEIVSETYVCSEAGIHSSVTYREREREREICFEVTALRKLSQHHCNSSFHFGGDVTGWPALITAAPEALALADTASKMLEEIIVRRLLPDVSDLK